MAVSLLLLAFGGALLAAAVVLRSRQPATVPAPPARLRAVRRRTLRWRWAGVLLGVVAATAAVLGNDIGIGNDLGRGVLLAAPLFALCVLVGVVAGELRVGAPDGPRRSAPLEVRRARDYVPRSLGLVVAGAAALLVALLTATTASASADDLGRAGRWLVLECDGGVVAAAGPWAGWFYSGPLAIVLLVGGGLAGVALQRVVRRPRQGEDLAVDDLLRRQAATAVTAATGLLVAVPLGGVSGVTAIALLGHACGPDWFPAAGTVLAVLALLMVALAGWCTTVLLVPSARAGRPPGVA